ncbi:MAG: response regulator [Opitutae bacterium]|nr:response regulator [Opitutae bacterium]
MPTPEIPVPPPGRCPVTQVSRLATRLAPAPLTRHPVASLFGGLLLLIVACEGLIMLVLARLPSLPPWQEALVDSLSLALLLCPALWLLTRYLARRIRTTEHEQLAARTAAILAISTDGVIVTDERGRILEFNRGAEQIFGYASAGIVGRSINLLLPERVARGHDEYLRGFARGATTARSMHDRNTLPGLRQDGSEVPVEISIAKAEVDGATIMVAVVRDATQRQRIEDELRRAKEHAETTARAKSEFLANMSHEIRTPMNAVIGLSDLLADTELTPEQRDYIETIRTSGDALLTILNDILDFSKLEAGRVELEHQPFDLRHCVESALDLFVPAAAPKRLDLAASIEDDVPATLEGDVTRLRQVLVNLVGNAVKFTEAGEVVVRVRRIAGEPAPREAATGTLGVDQVTLQFEISDTGIGIPAERMDRLFKSFSQVDAGTARRYGGTGLGLAICQRLVSMMGGRIQVESTPGRGTTFSFSVTLPELPLPAPNCSDPLPESLLAGRRMLVVDDNPTNRLILSRLLIGWGARVHACAGGAEAIVHLRRSGNPDCAIVDLHMPDLDGAELASHLRADPRTAGLPLVLLSSSGPHVEPAVRGLFSEVLAKPVKPAQLLRALHRTLGEPVVQRSVPVAGDAFPPQLASPLRILLAEDNLVNQKVALGLLQRLGYRPAVVGDGREVLEAVRLADYDVILMDVQMPEMDGREASRRLRADQGRNGKRPYIVALTASALEEDRAQCASAGMDDFVPKPLRAVDLHQVLSRAVDALNARSRGPEPTPHAHDSDSSHARSSRLGWQ